MSVNAYISVSLDRFSLEPNARVDKSGSIHYYVLASSWPSLWFTVYAESLPIHDYDACFLHPSPVFGILWHIDSMLVCKNEEIVTKALKMSQLRQLNADSRYNIRGNLHHTQFWNSRFCYADTRELPLPSVVVHILVERQRMMFSKIASGSVRSGTGWIQISVSFEKVFKTRCNVQFCRIQDKGLSLITVRQKFICFAWCIETPRYVAT